MDAVVTADIINYTKLTEEEADLVLDTIHSEFEKLELTRTNVINNFSIKRGDSIQPVSYTHPTLPTIYSV